MTEQKLLIQCNDDRTTLLRSKADLESGKNNDLSVTKKKKHVSMSDEDTFIDDHDLSPAVKSSSKYGAIIEHRISDGGSRYRDLKRSLSSDLSYSFIESLSFGFGESFNLHLAGALLSQDDIPSPDRVSSSSLMAVNLQTMILGTSVLSIPFCIKIAGIWGVVMIVVVGLFALLTGDMLHDCQYQKSYSKPGFYKRVNASFVDMANACWKIAGGYITKSFVYLSLARNVVILILLSDIMHCVLKDFNVTVIPKKLITVMWTILVLPLLFVRTVSRLAWVSFVGLNLYITAISTVLVISFLNYRSWNISNISTTFDIQGVGIATGIIINSYSVHMNLPALEASLKHPKSYRRTSAISFAVNIVIKVVFGVCGYLTYLGLTEQEITNNVHEYHPLPILLQIAVMFFAYFTIPLQNFVAFELIDTTFRHHFSICHDLVWMMTSRITVMVLCLLVAVLIPDFSVAMGLIGSVRGSMICLILPALFYIKLQKKDNCWNIVKRFACYGTIAFGCTASFVGVYSSVGSIVRGSDVQWHGISNASTISPV